jgi:hypothetical protein
MTIVVIKLKLVGPSRYALFGPKGNQIGPIYHGSKAKAKEWAKAFCSAWPTWNVDYKEINDAKADRVSK